MAVGRAGKVMRASVSAFFDGYHRFSSVAAMLALPFSAAVLASEAAAPSSSALRAVAARLRAVFAAAGFPPSAFFALLEAKLAQTETVVTFAFALPSALTFLLLAKATVAAMLRDDDDDASSPAQATARWRRKLALAALPSCGAVARAYPALVATHLLNAFLMLSVNAAVFSLLLLAFGAADLLGAGATSGFWNAATYSLAVGVATVVCNLAVVVAAMERGRAGHGAVLRACVLVRGRVSTALAVALPTNLCVAAAEALFQLRVVAARRRSAAAGSWLAPGVAGEAFSIAYIHALCVVLEIIVSCMFYRGCRKRDADEIRELEPEKGEFQA
ncbi:hypothetical protein EJB05_51374, partial [Eragrostis curvula]